MNDLQKQYYEILTGIHTICQQENLSYMLTGGTLLGAVRENGFIPWDDDADIMMHRNEYEAFESVCAKYFDAYGFGLDIGTRIPRVALKVHPEIHVEIILIDVLPQKELKRKILRTKLKLLQTMMNTRFDFSQHRSLRKPISYSIWIIGRLLGQPSKLGLYRKVSQEGDGEASGLVFFSNERYRFMTMEIPEEFLKETVLIPFEDTKLMVPQAWDKILKLYYGDSYMIPKRENYYAAASTPGKSN